MRGAWCVVRRWRSAWCVVRGKRVRDAGLKGGASGSLAIVPARPRSEQQRHPAGRCGASMRHHRTRVRGAGLKGGASGSLAMVLPRPGIRQAAAAPQNAKKGGAPSVFVRVSQCQSVCPCSKASGSLAMVPARPRFEQQRHPAGRCGASMRHHRTGDAVPLSHHPMVRGAVQSSKLLRRIERTSVFVRVSQCRSVCPCVRW